MKREADSDFLLGVIKGMMLSYKARSAYLGLDAVLGVATPLTCTRRTGWTRKKVMRNLTKLVSNGDLVLVKKEKYRLSDKHQVEGMEEFYLEGMFYLPISKRKEKVNGQLHENDVTQG
jgi:hypothetical protein